MMKITVTIPITSSSVNSISITSPLGKAKKKFSLPDKGKQPPPCYGALRIPFGISGIISYINSIVK